MLENKVKRTDKQRDTTSNVMIPEVWRGDMAGKGGSCTQGMHHVDEKIDQANRGLRVSWQ